jgi:hypothetical protein
MAISVRGASATLQEQAAPTARAPAPAPAPAAADVVLVGAGDIGYCPGGNDERTADLLDGIPGTVFTLGDNAYPAGSSADFANCYAPGWGRHLARTRPAPGNHDYDYGRGDEADGRPYHDYFGAAAGPPGRGYYSYPLGTWHIVVLNSTLTGPAATAQLRWLAADLQANPGACLLAYWHHPLFSSGRHRTHREVRDYWRLLYASGADVVLNGHDHIYERFAPQTPDGDRDEEHGTREFVVGTGGGGLHDFGTIAPNSEVHRNDRFGVLRLTLHADGYDWAFLATSGVPMDTGTDGCHPPPPEGP